MKFGKKLLSQQDIPLFRAQYVTYATMKQLIKDIQQSENKCNYEPSLYHTRTGAHTQSESEKSDQQTHTRTEIEGAEVPTRAHTNTQLEGEGSIANATRTRTLSGSEGGDVLSSHDGESAHMTQTHARNNDTRMGRDKDTQHTPSEGDNTKHARSDGEVLATQLWWFDSTQKTSLSSPLCPERIQFVRAVEDEVDKTQHLYISQVKTIKHMICDIYTRLNTRFRMDNIFSDIDSIAAELVLLDRYIWHAKQLILKITKKHDKLTYYKVCSWMLIRMERYEFWNPKLDELVVGVSDAYNAARLAEQENEEMLSNSRQVADTEIFVRKNEKYFVKPEDVMLVKLLVCRNIPLDIFERTKSKKGKRVLNMADLSGIQDASVINSIYLDNRERTMYHERTGLEGPKGNLIRIRWYGLHPNPCSECWVERKTRQAADETPVCVVDEAIKERFRVNSRNVGNYITNNWKMEKKVASMIAKKQIKEKDAHAMVQKANRIQDEIVGKKLTSALRTVVRRSAFQQGADQSLRFSLDMNLHIINENVSSEGGRWARNLDLPLKLSEVKTLPYAILEIKTQKETPEWVAHLKSSGYVIPSAHFSKFLYGTCKLAPSEVRFRPTWWESVLELEVSARPSPPLITCSLLGKTPSSVKFRANMTEIMQQRGRQMDEHKEGKRKPLPNKYMAKEVVEYPIQVAHPQSAGAAVVQIGGIYPKETPEKETGFFSKIIGCFRPKVMNKLVTVTAKQRAIEQRTAKTFFANERTMLSWLNHSTFMALAGVTLISSGSNIGQASGVALVAVTILFAGYALFKYLTRLYGLKGTRKTAGLDDKWGPPILVGIFIAVMVFLGAYHITEVATKNNI